MSKRFSYTLHAQLYLEIQANLIYLELVEDLMRTYLSNRGRRAGEWVYIEKIRKDFKVTQAHIEKLREFKTRLLNTTDEIEDSEVDLPQEESELLSAFLGKTTESFEAAREFLDGQMEKTVALLQNSSLITVEQSREFRDIYEREFRKTLDLQSGIPLEVESLDELLSPLQKEFQAWRNSLNQRKKVDFEFQILFEGDRATGMRSLIQCCATGEPVNDKNKQAEINNMLAHRSLLGKTVSVQLNNTHRDHTHNMGDINSMNYRGKHAVIILFDITDETSFNNVELWLMELQRYRFPAQDVFLVATKCDEARQVSKSKINDFIECYGLFYFETSARTGEGCQEMISQVTEILLGARLEELGETPDSEQLESSIVNNHEQDKSKQYGAANYALFALLILALPIIILATIVFSPWLFLEGIITGVIKTTN